MHHLPTRTNRGWLFVLGLLLVVGGVLGTLVSTGALPRLGRAAGVSLVRPGTDDTVLGAAVARQLETVPVVVGVVVGGLLLVLAGLAWLLRQIPRRGLAQPFRLHDDPGTGLTRVAPGVLTEAVARQVGGFAGVSRAEAQLRGSAREPELTVRLTADERTDVRRLVARLQQEVVADLQTALDTAVVGLAVRVDIDRGRSTVGQVTR